MPRNRNLNAIPPESEQKSVPAESTREAKSRLKSTGSKPAVRERNTVKDATASVGPSTVIAPEPSAPVPDQPVAAKDLEASVRSNPAKTVRAQTAATHTRKASERATNGPGSFDADEYREEISRLAYALWEGRGRTQGSPDEDWFRAEAEVLRRLKVSGAAA